MNKWKKNKIMATIGWASVITSIPWIIGASVIVTKFNDQRQVANKSKLEKEQSKTKNKQLDTKIKKNNNKIKAMEIEKQISTKHINQLKDKNKQQEIVHNEWYVKNSQVEIAKLEKEIKESEARHDESVEKLEGKILILEASKDSIEKNHDIQSKKLKRHSNYFSIIWRISPHKLWLEMSDFASVKDILDNVVSTITKKTTKLPTEVTYFSFDDFITKTTLIFNEKQKEKLKKIILIKIKVENHDDFQIVTLKIQKKEKIIAESTIKVTGFKSKS